MTKENKKSETVGVTLSGDAARGIRDISVATGVSYRRLANQMVGHMVKTIKDGGTITIDIESGDLNFGPAIPKARTPTPPIKSGDTMTTDPTQAREINMGG